LLREGFSRTLTLPYRAALIVIPVVRFRPRNSSPSEELHHCCRQCATKIMASGVLQVIGQKLGHFAPPPFCPLPRHSYDTRQRVQTLHCFQPLPLDFSLAALWCLPEQQSPTSWTSGVGQWEVEAPGGDPCNRRHPWAVLPGVALSPTSQKSPGDYLRAPRRRPLPSEPSPPPDQHPTTPRSLRVPLEEASCLL
jgi:hypothetical protein